MKDPEVYDAFMELNDAGAELTRIIAEVEGVRSKDPFKWRGYTIDDVREQSRKNMAPMRDEIARVFSGTSLTVEPPAAPPEAVPTSPGEGLDAVAKRLASEYFDRFGSEGQTAYAWLEGRIAATLRAQLAERDEQHKAALQFQHENSTRIQQELIARSQAKTEKLAAAEARERELVEALETVMDRLVDRHETDEAADYARAALASRKG